MEKTDFKKELKHLYRPSSRKFSVVDVPAMSFLMVDGHGDPNTDQSYQEALETLYALAYTLKFMSKKELEKDYSVMPLEGLWWAEDMERFRLKRDKSAWLWTMMIMQPQWITAAMVESAKKAAAKKKPLAALPQLRFELYEEGLAVQIMHIGPYDAEGPVIASMHDFICNEGAEPCGKHHEIYLSDPRRTAPEKLKTVLRQPFRALESGNVS